MIINSSANARYRDRVCESGRFQQYSQLIWPAGGKPAAVRDIGFADRRSALAVGC
jgi:hypothetical protein